jgi:hypothetical protein
LKLTVFLDVFFGDEAGECALLFLSLEEATIWSQKCRPQFLGFPAKWNPAERPEGRLQGQPAKG